MVAVKWQDIYQDAETVLDVCEDVIHVIDSILSNRRTHDLGHNMSRDRVPVEVDVAASERSRHGQQHSPAQSRVFRKGREQTPYLLR